MKIVNISELSILKNDSEIHLKDCMEKIHFNHVSVCADKHIMFKEFWDYLESNGEIVIFKCGNRFIIKRKKINGGELEMVGDNKKMIFADASILPKTNKGKTGKNWLEALQKIPEGQMWIIDSKEYSGSTIRQAIKRLVNDKKIKASDYTVTQRENKNETLVYVIHNAKKQ